MKKAVSIIALLFSAAHLFAQAAIKPGDVLDISCVEEPSLGGEYNVTDQGLIRMQFIGAVEVGGLTTAQAAEKISKTLTTQQILKSATISVKLKEREPQTVSVSGAVALSGDIEFRDGMKLDDVLKFAHPTESANLNQIKITRASGDNFTVDSTKPDGAAFAMKIGDKVFVPILVAGGEVTVLGAVAKPGIVPFQQGMRLRAALQAAGGLRSDADPHRIEIRSSGGTKTVDLASDADDFDVAAGDSIVVSLRPITEKVYVTGAVARPGLIPFEPGLTLSKAVDDASPLEGARIDKVRVNRKEIDQKPKTFTVNLKRVKAGSSPDFDLKSGDTIEVPYPAKASKSTDTIRYVGIGILLFFLLRR